jgi:hypothetical protein
MAGLGSRKTGQSLQTALSIILGTGLFYYHRITFHLK